MIAGKVTSLFGLIRYSVTILSAHSTSETNIAGLPNFAPH
jgi:hypothetical protein